MNDQQFRRGDQIAYIPQHADGDIAHPDVQYGFVTSGPRSDGSYFCRYWRNGSNPLELRTKAGSEPTPGDCLQMHPIVPQTTVQELLRTVC